MRLSSYDHSFIVPATVITIVNYDRTVIMIVNYDHKTFIVQATGLDLVSACACTISVSVQSHTGQCQIIGAY